MGEISAVTINSPVDWTLKTRQSAIYRDFKHAFSSAALDCCKKRSDYRANSTWLLMNLRWNPREHRAEANKRKSDRPRFRPWANRKFTGNNWNTYTTNSTKYWNGVEFQAVTMQCRQLSHIVACREIRGQFRRSHTTMQRFPLRYKDHLSWLKPMITAGQCARA